LRREPAGIRLRAGKLGEFLMNLEKQKRIEQRAYLFWQAEGQPHGRHEEHWHLAARQIESEEKVHITEKPRKKASGRATASSGRKKSKK
jgi:Protein of unknown function (DUF2934)